MLTFLSSTAVSFMLSAAAFICTGLITGYTIKTRKETPKIRLSLFWWFFASLLFYFALAFVLSRKIQKETLLYSASSTLAFSDVPAFSGLFLSVSCLFLLGFVLTPLLIRMMEDTFLFKKACGCSIVVFIGSFAALVLAVHILPVDVVWGGAHFSVLGVFAFSCFFMVGFSISRRLPVCRFRTLLSFQSIRDRGIHMFHKHPAFWYFLLYTASFAAVAVIVFSLQIAKEMGIIWEVDAKPQYLPYMRYTVQYLKELFTALLHGDFTMKMYDFTIGMGEDVRSVLRMRPLEFLAAFFSTKQTIRLYNVFMVIRYYISGLTFSFYTRYRKLPWLNTLIGSMVYVFCGYTLRYATKHPVFMVPMIMLPLLLLGMEKLIAEKKCFFFSLMVAISFFINYYFLYISTIALGVYALIRFPQIYREHRFKEFWGMMRRIAGYYLLGCGMAMASFLPTAIRTLNSERVGNTKVFTDSLFTYGGAQAAKVFLSSISSLYYAPGGIYLSFAVIVIPVLVVLFVRPLREYWSLKLVFLLETAGLLVPAAGLAMSLFSSVTNRWVYIVAFTAAFATACMVDRLHRMTRLQLLVLCAVTVAYGLCYRFVGKGMKKKAEDLWISFLFLVGITILLLLLHLLTSMSRRQALAVLSVCTALSLGFHGRYLFDNAYVPFIKEFVSNEEMELFFQKDEFLHLAKIEDPGFYRSDASTARDYYENSGLVFGYNGTSVYNSVINSSLVKYHLELESSGISAVHRIYSLDGRTAMEALADVKYYLTPAGKKTSVPYGFEKSDEFSYGEFDVYENQYPLSIGYTYDSLISRTSYEKLSALERQQIMLSSVVVDDAYKHLLTENAQLSEDIRKSEPTVLSKDDAVSITGNRYHFSEKNTGFTISYEKKAGYEAYLRLENLETESQRAKITVTTSDMEKNLIARDNNQAYSLGRNDYLLNLGYSDADGSEQVKFSFAVKGDYTLDDLEIYYVPMENYVSRIEERNAEPLENVAIGTNAVTGDITVSSDKILVFSIPYSKGFTAYVDGEKTELFKANTAYMGLYLKKGYHGIRLVYETPGLKAGIGISVASLLVFLVLLAWQCRKKKGD